MAADEESGADGEWKAPMALPWIVRFYGEEQSPDMENRTLPDILNFNDSELEYHHDYIQVLFPLPERSPFNPDAPVITRTTRDAFAANETLRKSLFIAFQRMGDFYAFDVSGDEVNPIITPKQNFRRLAKRTWLMRMNHNHLRITRIIRCLRILTLESVAQKFFEALEENAEGVSERSLMYWERAAKRPLHLPPDESNENATGVSWLREDAEDEKKANAAREPEVAKLAEIGQPAIDEKQAGNDKHEGLEKPEEDEQPAVDGTRYNIDKSAGFETHTEPEKPVDEEKPKVQQAGNVDKQAQ